MSRKISDFASDACEGVGGIGECYTEQSLQHSKKLKFYSVFKNNYKPSIYLDLTGKNPDRKAFVKSVITT